MKINRDIEIVTGGRAGGGKTQQMFEPVTITTKFVPNKEAISEIQPEEIQRLIDKGFLDAQRLLDDQYRKFWRGEWTHSVNV
jgi:hypothetical protein